MTCHCCNTKLSQEEANEVREFQSEPICQECADMRDDSQNNFDYEQFSDADPGL